MINRILHFFKTGPDRPLLQDVGAIRNLYDSKRRRLFLWLIIGYGFFYPCRVSFSVSKKPMLDAGVLAVQQMGIIGAGLLYVYAVGKFTNGFLADRANIGRFMSIALLLSALANLLFGFTSGFFLFIAFWGINGWFQSIGSAPSVVSLFQWFSKRERGTRYGLWAASHNLGEGMTFVGTAFIISALGWRWGFLAPGIACLVVAIFMLRNLADRPQTYGLPPVHEYKDDEPDPHSAKGESIGQLQLLVLRNPLVWIIGLSSALMYVARYAVNGWAVLFLQESKGYTLIEAGSVMAAYPLVGIAGAISSGYVSDRFFKSNRIVPALIYGAFQTAGIALLWFTPPGQVWMDTLALALFGFGIGGSIVFLAGLIAVDMMPIRAAGAVKGIIGLFSYMGAATQYWISGILIDNTKFVVDGETSHDFGPAFTFWIAASAASMGLILVVWMTGRSGRAAAKAGEVELGSP